MTNVGSALPVKELNITVRIKVLENVEMDKLLYLLVDKIFPGIPILTKSIRP